MESKALQWMKEKKLQVRLCDTPKNREYLLRQQKALTETLERFGKQIKIDTIGMRTPVVTV